MDEVLVRVATVVDGEAITTVQYETWKATYSRWIPDVVAGLDPHRTAANWAKAAASAEERVAVAVAGGSVVGYAWSGAPHSADHDGARTGELRVLYVAPRFQGRGAGQLLMADALEWLAGTDVAAASSGRSRRTEVLKF